MSAGAKSEPEFSFSFDFDFLIVGSGFGGSVSALRLAEKGYSVGVLEMGKRWRPSEFARTNWEVKKFLWRPSIGCHGIQQITLLRDVMVLHGAGVGGGSLVYANTLLVPGDDFFRDPRWSSLGDWKALLAPHYATAKRMLGVVETPHLGKTERLLQQIADDTGRGDTFHRAKVGVFFGEPGRTVPDPFFDGAGPERTGCTLCGACMVGCRPGAKNTLDKNYLYLAEQRGVQVIPETRVLDVKPLHPRRVSDGHSDGSDGGQGGYEVTTERSTAMWSRPRRTFRARHVVLSAGVLGTVDLLTKCRERGSLPNLSSALGTYVRTNSEALVGAKANDAKADFSEGIAIEAGFYPDDKTHIEAVRYPAGSDFMGLLGTLLVGGGPPWPRPLRFLAALVAHPISFLRTLNPFGWARRSTVLLVMQPLDNHLSLRRRRRWWWPFGKVLDSHRGDAPPVPSYIPVANATAERMAVKMSGTAQSVLPEVVMNLSSTAHILGGCPIGASTESGVVDRDCKVFGHDGLWVIDGSVVPANLGVNPSLTITALAEHAMAQVPPRG